eukprot:scaffold20700_cov71-Phaeocystis_antarctica.AAC.6
MFEKVKSHPPARPMMVPVLVIGVMHPPARPMAAAGALSCASAAAASGAASVAETGGLRVGATSMVVLVRAADGSVVGGRGSSLPTTLVSHTISAT